MKKLKQLAPSSPTNIEFINRLIIEWRNGETMEYDYFKLRFFCPCASCVDELTGERVLMQESVPNDVQPIKGEHVGNYALRIHWSDGHSTGIYTFNSLFEKHPAQITLDQE